MNIPTTNCNGRLRSYTNNSFEINIAIVTEGMKALRSLIISLDKLKTYITQFNKMISRYYKMFVHSFSSTLNISNKISPT